MFDLSMTTLRRLRALTYLLVAIAILLLLYAHTASAQAAETIVAPSSWLYEVWTIVQPLAVLLVTLVGPALVGWLSIRLNSLLQISDDNARKENERRIREALHAAALNALKFAMTRAGLPQAALPGPAIISEAIDYVRTKSPDTAAQAGIDDRGLTEIILSKVPDVLAQIAAAKGTSAR